MRAMALGVLWCLFAMLPAIAQQPSSGQQGTPGQQDRAAAVLSAARQALGGETKLSAVKTLIAQGRTRQVRGDNLVPIEFEIQIELPDKYSRHDEFPAQDAGPTTSGFSGTSPIQIPPGPTQPEAAVRVRLTTAQQDFARLALGLLATSFSGFPLTFKYVGQAEAPQGKADVIDASGPGNFSARMFINSDTHLPMLVSWHAPPPPARRGGPQPPGPPPAGPPAAGAPAGSRPAGAPSAVVEQRLFFADYREVDGIKLPFRLRRASGAETTEETTFDRYRINARIDPRRFVTN